MSRIAVADAGPLIHLCEIGALDLLGLFEAVLVPETVWQEATHPGRVPEASLARLRVAERRRDPPPTAADAGRSHLQAGERMCLRLCEQEGIRSILTDDLRARETAEAEGLTPTGSLGVVVRAFREGRIAEQKAERLLKALRDESTLFVRSVLVNRVIEQLRRG